MYVMYLFVQSMFRLCFYFEIEILVSFYLFIYLEILSLLLCMGIWGNMDCWGKWTTLIPLS